MALNLFTETFILAIGMALLCALPLFFSGIRKQSKVFFLMGTGAMFGICVFDLVPDLFEMGGRSSLFIVGAVWLLYSIIHLWHIGHHHLHPLDLPENPGDHGAAVVETPYLFLFSVVAHCFASGMLLAVSQGFSQKLAGTVFAALLAHKGYESLMVSSILLEKKQSLAARITAITIYASALPVGVLLTMLFRANLNQQLATWISSIAVGTLMGCLIFDFLIPSFQQLRRRRLQIAWLVLGLILTQVVMRFV